MKKVIDRLVEHLVYNARVYETKANAFLDPNNPGTDPNNPPNLDKSIVVE